MKVRYFDNAATTRVKEEVLKEMIPYFSDRIWKSIINLYYRKKCKKAIEEARKSCKFNKCSPKEIYFTGCGSESDNTALKGIAYANKKKGKHIITSKIEHPAILNTCKSFRKKGFKVTYLNVNQDGFINLEELRNAIRKYYFNNNNVCK